MGLSLLVVRLWLSGSRVAQRGFRRRSDLLGFNPLFDIVNVVEDAIAHLYEPWSISLVSHVNPRGFFDCREELRERLCVYEFHVHFEFLSLVYADKD